MKLQCWWKARIPLASFAFACLWLAGCAGGSDGGGGGSGGGGGGSGGGGGDPRLHWDQDTWNSKDWT